MSIVVIMCMALYFDQHNVKMKVNGFVWRGW
jgi:hypothetical protein